VGFREVRAAAIEALKDGRVHHEARNDANVKNLLLTGVVSPEDVIGLLKACRGDQYKPDPHHQLTDVDVHVFKPMVGKVRWYVKLYFLEPDVWFISVHK
jgi:hypothetical protein